MSQPVSPENYKKEEPEINRSRPSTPLMRHPEFCFDNTLIAIRIENTLFNVHKYQLMKSTTFSDMFAISEESQDPSKSQEGLSLENPIVMKGVSASDFECLMRVLYARQSYPLLSHFSSQQPEPKAPLIIPAFRLANMWNFSELCAYLVPLAEQVLNEVDKIVFAREFKVVDWLLPAHAKLCLRKEPITNEEASKLGVESLLFISRFREESARKGAGIGSCSNCVVGAPQAAQCEVEKEVKKWLDNGCIVSI